jgi:hypothetical protein
MPPAIGGSDVTDTQIPDGLAVETVYVVEISYAPDARERRPAVRLEHLTRVGRLVEEGTLVLAGGFLDFRSAMLIVRAESEAAAVELVRDDVYVRSGVWLDDARARAFGLVVRTAGDAT